MICNTAIFYDIENLLGLFSEKTNTVLHLDEIYRRVLEVEGVHGVSIQRAYADWGLPIARNLRGSVLQVGIETIQIFNTNPNDKMKNAADVSLIIDAMDLLSRRPEIENYVIASGDGIFAFLAKKLHENGKRVIGCSFDTIASNIFLNACDYFISLQKMDSSISATISRKKMRYTAPIQSVAAPKLVPQPPPTLPPTFQKSKYSEAIVNANIKIWRDLGDTSGSIHVVRQMVEAVFEDYTKTMPGLEISVFTNYINHYLPGFKASRFGFKRVSEFMRFILTGSPYCLYYINDSILVMSPRENAKGNLVEDVKGLLITSAEGNIYNSVFSVPEDESFIFSITQPEPVKKPTPAPKPPVAVPNAVVATSAPTPVVELTKTPEPVIEEPAPVIEAPVVKIPAKRGRKTGWRKQVATPEPVPAPAPEIIVEGSIRKWIKARFEELSNADALPTSEVRKMTTPEYSVATFGVRNPILREIETRGNLTEQRTANGKIKYWKESFRFNGKTYLVYKEWAAGLHQERFVAWLSTFTK
ncbi:MAG: NYN domain-containing protein [Defluviitaleaceae bacterium]|nr:NYN domain-containing protein [Defluviitaleaceae bacterium]